MADIFGKEEEAMKKMKTLGMERGFVALSLGNEEEEVVQVQKGPDLVSEKEELCLVGMDLERVLKGSPWT
ncbi:hypothetical protein J1N35_007177 [Gossypium stocksii]|uniref:Uncharacterized protein n=1 Tax=Gossypium stocksii TaxID=47602 RepID=A0A9D3W5J7_9ROSI|nr:hypothetical protein J1N35_007177 [Gossypium stocksii]